ncbi:MAG: GTPase HflX [Deltaproteobacteria bacterium]|nr:GTPase HflX [Deltaproteobacteria bacterium]
MIDVDGFLLPLEAARALFVSDGEWGLEELEGLFVTLGGKPVCDAGSEKLLVQIRRIDPGSYLGKGKLEEIARILEARALDLLVVDFELSPSQMKTIEKVTKKLVLDRSGIILEIFNRHARTKEAKLQVEIARLEYLMPRLTRMWTHFERQSGSGGGALKGKGMGEKQIEVDRRLVKDRMNMLHRKLGVVEKSRGLHRRGREALLKVALVGYTNAGKSTLLNRLTHSEVHVEDALFATLDASVRLLNPRSRPVVLAIDTVGFIDRLPHALVASFRSTLGEVLEADLLVHVLEGSHPEVRRHFDVTMAVLKALEADRIPMLLVLNKMDLLSSPADAATLKVWATGIARKLSLEAPVFVSAFSDGDVGLLRERILKSFESKMTVYEVVVPFEDGRTAAKIHEVGSIEAKRPTERGTFFRLKTLPEFAEQLNLARYKV